MGALFSALGLTDLIKYAIKFAIIFLVLALVALFVQYSLSLLPEMNLHGCMGHYAVAWGLVDGFRLYISIVVYGFTVKTGLSLISRFFD